MIMISMAMITDVLMLVVGKKRLQLVCFTPLSSPCHIFLPTLGSPPYSVLVSVDFDDEDNENDENNKNKENDDRNNSKWSMLMSMIFC